MLGGTLNDIPMTYNFAWGFTMSIGMKKSTTGFDFCKKGVFWDTLMPKPEKKIQNQQFMRKYAPEFIFSIKRALIPY